MYLMKLNTPEFYFRTADRVCHEPAFASRTSVSEEASHEGWSRRESFDALFGAMGAKPGNVDQRSRLVYTRNGGHFLITKPIVGNEATQANGATIGFTLDNPDQALAWHRAGVENGGTAVEDPPGVRPKGCAFLACIRDPDGNKLCGLHRTTA